MARVLSALTLIPLVVILIGYAPPLIFAAFVALLLGLALFEFYRIANRLGARCFNGLGLMVGVSLVAALWFQWPHPLEILLAGTLACGALCLFSEHSLDELARGWAFTAFGWLYVAVPLALLYSLRFDSFGQTGSKLVLFLLVLQWIQDTAAFYVGRAWGRHKIAPRFSPNKSVEGSLAGLVSVLLAGLAFHLWIFDDSKLWLVLLLSLALGFAGQMSDIAESLFKRAAGIKDSSQLIPGHGGVLDRIDGLLFATPLLWLMLHHWQL